MRTSVGVGDVALRLTLSDRKNKFGSIREADLVADICNNLGVYRRDAKRGIKLALMFGMIARVRSGRLRVL